MNEPVSWTRRVWARQDSLAHAAWLLALPLSCAYGAAVGLRNFLYRSAWLPTKALPGAVVSVGNLTVGGTGKTPTTLWIADELRQRGYRVVEVAVNWADQPGSKVGVLRHAPGMVVEILTARWRLARRAAQRSAP